jgi:hypothetical protein
VIDLDSIFDDSTLFDLFWSLLESLLSPRRRPVAALRERGHIKRR